MYFQFLDAAEFQPVFPIESNLNQETKVFIPHCTYGKEASFKCQDVSTRLQTPLGTCHTINANGGFGKVKRVGSKWGLQLAIDLKHHDRHLARFKEEDSGYVKVGYFFDKSQGKWYSPPYLQAFVHSSYEYPDILNTESTPMELPVGYESDVVIVNVERASEPTLMFILQWLIRH